MEAYSVNKRALFDYEILETYEAGIELYGFEVKSARNGQISLAGSYVVIRREEAWLLNATVPPYQPKNTPTGYEPTRPRRLLLKRSEIKELVGRSAQKGLTLVPLKVYNKKSKIKLEFGLARRKKTHDKRELLKERQHARELERGV